MCRILVETPFHDDSTATQILLCFSSELSIGDFERSLKHNYLDLVELLSIEELPTPTDEESTEIIYWEEDLQQPEKLYIHLLDNSVALYGEYGNVATLRFGFRYMDIEECAFERNVEVELPGLDSECCFEMKLRGHKDKQYVCSAETTDFNCAIDSRKTERFLFQRCTEENEKVRIVGTEILKPGAEKIDFISDKDNDGIPDVFDSDDDNDGIPDWADRVDNNPVEENVEGDDEDEETEVDEEDD